MSKELEAFKRMRDDPCSWVGYFIEELDIIENALNEYEKYKELENKLGCSFEELLADNVFGSTQVGLAIINNLVARNNELRKKAKALRIIENKCVDIEWFKRTKYCEEYNDGLGSRNKKLTQEEYDLLKEVLFYGL